MSEEFDRLNAIAAKSLYDAGPSAAVLRYTFSIVSRYIRGDSILEMGPAEGHMTDLFATLPAALTILEGSTLFCEQIKRRHPSVTVVNALFEDFKPERGYDTIVMGHVLEHVVDPVEILKYARAWLAPGGRIFAAVPNSRSVHRQAAVSMGLLGFEEELNAMDIHHGHRRVYNPETFRRDFLAAGLNIEMFGGYWLKPMANRQIEETWSPEMLQAFIKLGERYPDIAAEIYVVASAG